MPHISKTTVCSCVTALRDIMAKTHRSSAPKLGGDVLGQIIEMDESLFGKKRKNNKGREFKKSWVFGLVDRNTRTLCLQIIKQRNTQTRIPIIQDHVDITATIYHDDCAVYRHLDQYGYRHNVVVHTKEFRAKDGTHTNTIEGIWGVLKQRLGRMHGIRHENLQNFLDEYCFRFQNKSKMLSALFDSLSAEVL